MSVTEALRPWFDLALKAATQRDTTKVDDGYLMDAAKAAEREARAALLDELEAAVRTMDATCHDGEGLRCEHVEDWPGVPGAPFDDGCNTDVSRAAVLALIQQHREEGT